MLILTIRTDKPEAEIGLFEDDEKLDYLSWQAHRELAVTIHQKIEEITKNEKIQAVAVFRGPGSFTGLRIGISVANALADSLQIPVVATDGEDWLPQAVDRLKKGENDQLALPEYGAPVKTTPPRK